MPSSSHVPGDSRESPARRQRRRRTHHRTDSNGELLGKEYRTDRDRDRDRDVEEYTDPEDSSPRRHRRDRESRGPDRRERRRHERRTSSRALNSGSEYTTSRGSAALSSGQLEKLDRLNKKLGYEAVPVAKHNRPEEIDTRTRRGGYDDERDRELERERRRAERKRRKREEERRAWLEEGDGYVSQMAEEGLRSERKRERRGRGADYEHERRRTSRHKRKDRRVASGQTLEMGGSPGGYRGGGGYYSEKDDYSEDIRRRDGDISTDPYFDGDEEEARTKKRRKKIFIGIGVFILLLVIIIPVAVVVSRKNQSSSAGSGGAESAAKGTGGAPSNTNLKDISEDSIPEQYKGTWLDPFSWYDTEDFNVTFTDEMVGGLPIMGLNSAWDDTTRANDKVPPLNEPFEYGKMAIRGVNIGGWFSIEPWITPSLFAQWRTSDGVVDEYTLCQKLGPINAKSTLEKHYSSWAQESTFAELQAAGFDHVRLPFGYWAVTTYDDDPYVAQVAWRYLLRAIEWARKYGLRVNLDLHGAPGSQNGWNHSGRQGAIGWLNGVDGTLNGDRTIDVHKQLSAFFTQPRYKNLVTMYGLVNEPRMVELDQSTVLSWTEEAIAAIRANNFDGIIVFGDGFMGLDNWQGKLTGQENLLLDVHQYVIFNVDQIVLNHHDKVNFACGAWTQQALRSQNTATGFGPTLCGEWSQAETDCAKYLNNVGVGSRWEGTLNMNTGAGGSDDGSVLTPKCPTSPQCSCDGANADPSTYSDGYKQFLLMFAEAQMHSFEQGWGWFYWTWKTEESAQWSYKKGMEIGTLPKLAYERGFNCEGDIPMFDDLPEFYRM